MEAFKEHAVIPDVMDKPPTHILKVSFGGVEVTPADTLTPTQVQDIPRLEWPTEDGAYYTVVMTDPDAPSREKPKFREWHHWLVVNVQGCDVSKGEVKSPYVGSGPPKGTNLHRYVIMVFKQPKGKTDFSSVPTLKLSGDNRGAKKVCDYLVKPFNLTELVAANFYQAEYDDYVPKLYQKLSGK